MHSQLAQFDRPKTHGVAAMHAIFFALCTAAGAQTLYFDVNGNGTNGSSIGSGVQASGSYNWDTAATYWTALSTGGESGGQGSPNAVKAWTQNAAAVFSAGTNGTAAYTVNVAANINASSITIEEGTPSFTVASGLSLSAGSVSASNFAIGGAGTTTLSGTVNVGSGTITKSGSGTLNLTGSANSLTGKLSVSGGTVALTSSQSTSQISGSGGTISFGPGSTLTIAGASSHTYGGTLAGLGGLKMNSSGATLTLSGGSSTYSGPTTLSAGTLRLNAPANMAPTSSFTLSGGTLDLGGTGTFQTSGTLRVSGASTINFASSTSIIQTIVFADSSSTSWTAPVTINNYDSTYHRIQFGNGSGAGLTGSQLSLVSLTGYSGSSLSINSQGYLEVGSAIPEPSTYAALFGAAALGAAGWHRRRRHAAAAPVAAVAQA